MRLDGLQCGRAIAALMVAIFHANLFLLPSKFYDGQGAGAVFNFGYAGVEFFFVLSGFIMMYVHDKDFGQPARTVLFLKKRIIRIYPIYWVILTGLILLYFAAPGSGPENARDTQSIMASYLLLPLPAEEPILRVAWTLQHEMLFYLIFSVLLLNIRLGMALCALWITGCLFALLTGGLQAFPFDMVFKSHNLLFVFGIIAAKILPKVTRDTAVLCFWIGSASFLGQGMLETLAGLALPKDWIPLGYGLSATLVILGLARAELPAPRWLAYLGDASYSIYLVHMPTMTIAAVALRKAGVHEVLPPLAMLALITCLVTLVGVVVHAYVEKPLMNAFKPKLTARAST
ncbi:acyltransferase [Epibacterium ulvae]|uniref:acyltransferase family protein n=1 Tax=Epibacterium ulvae TaxID=1156985 RepID=UPI001BFC0156|nr:acyltransferase [Epibacterium ulvae]MBT8155924.1 acyltransferase [Epibacterium ulvae]